MIDLARIVLVIVEAINLRTAFGLFPFGGESGIFSGMTQDLPPIAVHPTGEQSTVALGGAAAAAPPLVVDSFAGSVRVEWDHATASRRWVNCRSSSTF